MCEPCWCGSPLLSWHWAHHTVPAPDLTLKQELKALLESSATLEEPLLGHLPVLSFIPQSGQWHGQRPKAGVEIRASAWVAEHLPHSHEEGVDGCNFGGSAAGLLLNFCFAPWICETNWVFIHVHTHLFARRQKCSHISRNTSCLSH